VRVTVGQVEVSTDTGANVVVARSVVAEGARLGADLVVLPEYASAYDHRGVGPAHAQPFDGPFVRMLEEESAAGGLVVVAGVVLPSCGEGDDRASNAVVVVDRGTVVATYRKVHLYDAFGGRESERLEPGDPAAPAVVVDVAGLRVGVMTCYDLRFPESARRLVDAGAQVLVVPAAWVDGPLKADHWRTLARARAIENVCAVVAVGQAGKGLVGRSLVVGPDGHVGLELDERAAVRTVDVDPDALVAARDRDATLTNRRYTVVPR
jgi:deaminated glutathione amidase